MIGSPSATVLLSLLVGAAAMAATLAFLVLGERVGYADDPGEAVGPRRSP